MDGFVVVDYAKENYKASELFWQLIAVVGQTTPRKLTP